MTTGYFQGDFLTTTIVDLKPPGKQATLSMTCKVKEAAVIDGEACVPVPSRA